MSNEDEDVPAHRWFYADTRTLEGALQRGRGVGALRALKDPQQAAEAVYACIRRDHRWDWQIDERGTYLARLVRDLGLDTAPITAQLWSTDRVAPEEDDHAFELSVGVLTRLALAGYGGAEAELLRYLREGERWTYVIEALAAGWPVERWDGLRDPALARLARPAAEREELFAWREPWQRWQPEGIPPWAGPRPRPRPYRETEDPGLLAALTDPALSPASKGEALFELARRPPRPELLELAPSLTTGKPPRPLTGLRRAILAQGALALPQARLWSADPGSPLRGLGLSVAGGGCSAPAPGAATPTSPTAWPVRAPRRAVRSRRCAGCCAGPRTPTNAPTLSGPGWPSTAATANGRSGRGCGTARATSA